MTFFLCLSENFSRQASCERYAISSQLCQRQSLNSNFYKVCYFTNLHFNFNFLLIYFVRNYIKSVDLILCYVSFELSDIKVIEGVQYVWHITWPTLACIHRCNFQYLLKILFLSSIQCWSCAVIPSERSQILHPTMALWSVHQP